MEAAGSVAMFGLSMETKNIRYNPYEGDGDSKVFNPYGPDYTLAKEECIGHMHKRVGSRLQSLVNKRKVVHLGEGKGLSGQGRLTLARIG